MRTLSNSDTDEQLRALMRAGSRRLNQENFTWMAESAILSIFVGFPVLGFIIIFLIAQIAVAQPDDPPIAVAHPSPTPIVQAQPDYAPRAKLVRLPNHRLGV